MILKVFLRHPSRNGLQLNYRIGRVRFSYARHIRQNGKTKGNFIRLMYAGGRYTNSWIAYRALPVICMAVPIVGRTQVTARHRGSSFRCFRCHPQKVGAILATCFCTFVPTAQSQSCVKTDSSCLMTCRTKGLGQIGTPWLPPTAARRAVSIGQPRKVEKLKG